MVRVSDALGWYDPPADCDWQLLVADMTGLPALGRIVENLPAGSRAYVIVETIDAADWQQLASAAEVSYAVAVRHRPRPRAERAGVGRPAVRAFRPAGVRLVRR